MTLSNLLAEIHFVSLVYEVAKLHQHLQVKVFEVDEDRKRMQLTMVI